jgi:hypothetical protein
MTLKEFLPHVASAAVATWLNILSSLLLKSIVLLSLHVQQRWMNFKISSPLRPAYCKEWEVHPFATAMKRPLLA